MADLFEPKLPPRECDTSGDVAPSAIHEKDSIVGKMVAKFKG
jgi:hypothetical protein